jgi:hypothetical protein
LQKIARCKHRKSQERKQALARLRLAQARKSVLALSISARVIRSKIRKEEYQANKVGSLKKIKSLQNTSPFIDKRHH